MDAALPARSAQRAFDRAVARERDAIARHDAAAWHQDKIAAQLEERALTEADDALRDLSLTNAAHARERATRAHRRAADARARLLAEGVDPDPAAPGST